MDGVIVIDVGGEFICLGVFVVEVEEEICCVVLVVEVLVEFDVVILIDIF